MHDTPVLWRTRAVIISGAAGVALAFGMSQITIAQQQSLMDNLAEHSVAGLVCEEDQVYGTIDGEPGVHCLNPDDPYVEYVGGHGWKAD